MSLIQGNTKAAAAGGYEIDQSIRFDGSSHLRRAFTSAGDRRTWTWSGWVKRAALNGGTNMMLFGAANPSGIQEDIRFGYNPVNKLALYCHNASGSAQDSYYITDAVYRDPGAWMHIVVAKDTTQATDSDRLKLYVNGEQPSLGTADYPSLNYQGFINNNIEHKLAAIGTGASGANYYSGYLADVYFIDGYQLEATDFGEFNNDGVWIPKEYTNASGYGTTGFYITGADSADLGADESGNGNDFTSSGLTSDDQMLDTPTNNFATLSPINLDGVTLSNGNLFCASAGYWSGAAATISIPNTGKWYIETLVGNRYGSYQNQGFVPTNYDRITEWSQAVQYGANDSTYTPNFGLGFSRNDVFGFYSTSGTTNATVTEPDGTTTYSTNDLYICHALDLDNERYWVGTAFTTDSSVTWFGPSGSGADPETPSTGLDISAYLTQWGDYGLTFFHGPNATSGSPSATVDFGQSGYTFPKPDGFNTVSTANLPSPSISDPSAHFFAKGYTGTGVSGTSITNDANAGNFKPDLLIVTPRNVSENRVVFDSVRGTTSRIYTNKTDPQDTDATALLTFEANGFDLDTTDGNYNGSGNSYIAWQWHTTGGTSGSNTDGSTSSTVSANVATSVVQYTGTGSAATVGHGLGSAPKMVIVKQRGATRDWPVYHSGLTSAGYTLFLNSTLGETALSSTWNSTAPTSSVFSVGTDAYANQSGGTYIAYCFAEIDGYSKLGRVTGNGSSSDGIFVWCGFKPSCVWIKRVSSSDNWVIIDSTRDPYNVADGRLYPDLQSAEISSTTLDLLSNGFKLRAGDGGVNASGSDYIFVAFGQAFGGDGVAPMTAR